MILLVIGDNLGEIGIRRVLIVGLFRLDGQIKQHLPGLRVIGAILQVAVEHVLRHLGVARLVVKLRHGNQRLRGDVALARKTFAQISGGCFRINRIVKIHVALHQIAQRADRQIARFRKLRQHLQVFRRRLRVFFLAEKVVRHHEFRARRLGRQRIRQVDAHFLAVLRFQNPLDVLGRQPGRRAPRAVAVFYKYVVVLRQRGAVRLDGLFFLARLFREFVGIFLQQTPQQGTRPGHRAFLQRQAILLEHLINGFDDVHVGHQHFFRAIGIAARQLHVGHHHKRVHKLQVQPAPLNYLANLDGIFQQLVFLIAAFLLRRAHERFRPVNHHRTLDVLAGFNLLHALVAGLGPHVIADHFLHLRELIGRVAIETRQIRIRRHLAFILFEKRIVQITRLVHFANGEEVARQSQTDRLRLGIGNPHLVNQRFRLGELPALNHDFRLNDAAAVFLTRVLDQNHIHHLLRQINKRWLKRNQPRSKRKLFIHRRSRSAPRTENNPRHCRYDDPCFFLHDPAISRQNGCTQVEHWHKFMTVYIQFIR